MKRIVRGVVGLLLGASTAAAATLSVPGQFSTIQMAIDAASPGDTIVVNGGTYAPIVIDKALTIIGDPAPTIDNTATPFVDLFVVPAITLSGAGGGVVRLVNLKTRGMTDGSVNFTNTNSGVAGGGFAELHVEDCDIEAAEWFQLTGFATGEPGISTSVPYVFLARSRVRASATDTDTCDPGLGLPPGEPAILAPTSTVVTIDSDVRGGAGVILCYSLPSCPGVCPCPAVGAFGGDGIVCDRLFTGGSQNVIAGGPGSDVFCFNFSGAPVTAGKQPDGTPIVANEHISLGHDLVASGPLELQKAVTLFWNSTVLNSMTLISTPKQPILVSGAGWLFLETSTLVVVLVPFDSYVQANVPNQPSLVGATVAFQVFDPTNGLTLPYVSTIQP